MVLIFGECARKTVPLCLFLSIFVYFVLKIWRNSCLQTLTALRIFTPNTNNSLLSYCTILCDCILPYVIVFVIVIVLYKYICFDLRATVGCFVASNLASLPQRLFLNAHVWDSRYVKTYPSHSARELSDPGGVRVSLMSSFKSICW